MDITVQKAISSSRNHEKQLVSYLAANNVSYAQLEETLAQICSACSTALLQDFESASAQHAESRIWDSHQKVHNYYRTALATLRATNEKDLNPVALRKLESSYMKFIKTAQKFYRGYIQNLSLNYPNIPELERVARKVHFDGQTRPRPNVVKANPASILLSCHATLIHLGDLSRYRETELNQDRKKNWAPAVGFYDLAISVLPSSGLSYNQLAVIALADGSLFRATYQLYRAISTENPHPSAEANLRRAFFKITSAWKDGSLNVNEIMTGGAGLPSSLVSWYLRLISCYFHGKPFPERDEIENEVIHQLDVDLRKKQKGDPPHRMTKINIAAGHAAQERLVRSDTSTEDNTNSYLYFLRLNIRTCTALLHIFLDEVRGLGDASELGKVNSKKGLAERIKPSMRRVLPALRLYSFWLQKNTTVLTKPIDASFSKLQEDLWTTYAKCLSAVTQAFPSEHLATVEYLLDEDEDTIGFQPLVCEKNHDVWYSGGKLRSRWHDVAENTRDINMEMLSRVTGFIVVGLKLAMDPDTSIVLEENSCKFLYQPVFEQFSEVVNGVDELVEASTATQTSVDLQQLELPTEEEDTLLHADIEAQRMVDNIVGFDDTMTESTASMQAMSNMAKPDTPPHLRPYNRATCPPSSPFPVGTHTAMDLLQAVQNYSQNNRRSLAPQSSIPTFPGLGIESDVSPGFQSPAINQQPLLSPALGGSFADRFRTPQQQVSSSSRPGTGLRASPLGVPGQGRHSRMNSNDSTGSGLIADATWSSFQPAGNVATATSHPHRRSLYNDRGLGNGTFGDLSYRRESNHDGRIESAVGSPSLSSTNIDAWGRSGSGFALGGTPGLDASSSVHQYSPQWNIQGSVWGSASGTTTPAAGRHLSRDFASFSRPFT